MVIAIDEFILYDEIHYNWCGWSNRDQTKTPQEIQWLRVSVHLNGKFNREIRETQINVTEWAAAYWKTLVQNYQHHFLEINLWSESYNLE